VTKARGALASLRIHYGGILCKDTTAAVALKPVLLIERLLVVDNASGIAATAWLKTRAVGDSSDVGRCTKSERLEVCELIAHSLLSVNFGMNAFIGCAHETRAIAPLSDVIAASRARRTGAERVDAIENAATSVLAQRLVPPKVREARGERQSNAKRAGDSIWRIRLYRTACRPRASR
jgi:hypothetical protein